MCVFYGRILAGDIMKVTENITAVFNYLDRLSESYSKTLNKSYLEGLKEALNYLLDDVVSFENTQLLKHFETEKAEILDQNYPKETIRKSIQLALLRGFKYDRITNAQMTPDSIGIFLSYLVKKLYNQENIKVLDPLIGTGNLIAAMSNHLESTVSVHGIDDDPLMCDLARNMFDALEIDHQIFHQDTLTFNHALYDLLVTDFPPKSVSQKSGYLPYYTIAHHLEHLQVGQYFIAIIENDFFDQKEHITFRKILDEKAHLFGIIKLDESLFKTHPKSILILKKKADPKEKINDFLIVDLPSFSDREAFNKALYKMEQWFTKKEVDVQ